MAVIREKTLQECSHLTEFDSGFSEKEEANNLSLHPKTQTLRSKQLPLPKKYGSSSQTRPHAKA